MPPYLSRSLAIPHASPQYESSLLKVVRDDVSGDFGKMITYALMSVEEFGAEVFTRATKGKSLPAGCLRGAPPRAPVPRRLSRLLRRTPSCGRGHLEPGRNCTPGCCTLTLTTNQGRV